MDARIVQLEEQLAVGERSKLRPGVENIDYIAQREALTSFDEDAVVMADRFTEICKHFDEALVNR